MVMVRKYPEEAGQRGEVGAVPEGPTWWPPAGRAISGAEDPAVGASAAAVPACPSGPCAAASRSRVAEWSSGVLPSPCEPRGPRMPEGHPCCRSQPCASGGEPESPPHTAGRCPASPGRPRPLPSQLGPDKELQLISRCPGMSRKFQDKTKKGERKQRRHGKEGHRCGDPRVGKLPVELRGDRTGFCHVPGSKANAPAPVTVGFVFTHRRSCKIHYNGTKKCEHIQTKFTNNPSGAWMERSDKSTSFRQNDL